MGKLMAAFLLVTAILTGGCAQKEGTAISADGVPIKFTVKGEGTPVLVFITGWGGNRTAWEAQMDYFTPKHRVVTIDLAGFGESGNERDSWTMGAFGDDVAAVVKKLDLEPIVLIGLSMGGAVILETVRRIPERVVGLVLVDIFKNVESKYTEEQIGETVSWFINLAKNPDVDTIRSAFFTLNSDKALIEKVAAEWSSAPKKGWEESLQEFFRWASNELTVVLQETQVPICSINSDNEPTDVEAARRYAPSFRAKIISGVGHVVMWEAPEEFNRILEETVAEFVDAAASK